MRKKAFVILTTFTLLFAPVSSRACEVTPGCLGITVRITRGIVRIIRSIYNFHHNNNEYNRNNINIAPRNIVDEIVNNIDNHSHNHNRYTAARIIDKSNR